MGPIRGPPRAVHRNTTALETTFVRSSSGDRVRAAQLLKQPEIRINSFDRVRFCQPGSRSLVAGTGPRQPGDVGEIRRLSSPGARAGRAVEEERATSNSEHVPVCARAWPVSGGRPPALAGSPRNTRPGFANPRCHTGGDCRPRRLSRKTLSGIRAVSSREFQDRLTRRARRAGITVSPALAAKLEAYFKLLTAWNTKMNLTGLNLAEQGPAAHRSIAH